MKITRRKFLYRSIGSIPLFTVNPRLLSAKEIHNGNWKGVCREWMHVLMPDDANGPGADNPYVWERIDHLMQEPDLARWLKLGFSQLEKLDTPNSKEQLYSLLEHSSATSVFLRKFNEILIENYYGTDVGWHDLGFDSPPQPSGYPIR